MVGITFVRSSMHKKFFILIFAEVQELFEQIQIIGSPPKLGCFSVKPSEFEFTHL